MSTGYQQPPGNGLPAPEATQTLIKAKFPDIYDQLTAPFDPREEYTRVVGKDSRGQPRTAKYARARAYQNRLDSVVGPDNWWTERPTPLSNLGVAVGVTVRFPDGSTITKWNACEWTQIAPIRGGYTDAFKRACAEFGIGRYLYGDGMVSYEEDGEVDYDPTQNAQQSSQSGPQGQNGGYQPQGGYGPPQGNYGPQGGGYQGGQDRGYQQGGQGGGQRQFTPTDYPRNSKALFRWLAELSERFQVSRPSLVDRVTDWGVQGMRLPERITSWPEQVLGNAISQAIAMVRALPNYGQDPVFDQPGGGQQPQAGYGPQAGGYQTAPQGGYSQGQFYGNEGPQGPGAYGRP